MEQDYNTSPLGMLHNIYETLNSPTDFYLELAKGNIPGATYIHRVGKLIDVGSTYETIWDIGGDYPYLTGATQLIASSDNDNDIIDGIGGRNIEIFGLDENYNAISETIETNGKTGVLTQNNYIRIFGGKVTSAGDEENLIGNFYLGTGSLIDGVPNQILMKITPENNASMMSLYTIPAGKVGYLVGKSMSSSRDKETSFKISIRSQNEVFRVIEDDIIYQSFKYIFYPIPISSQNDVGIPEKTDIEMRAKVDTGLTKVICGYDLILLDK